MANQYILIFYYIMWGLLVFTSISFLVSGLDDLFFDFFYWTNYFIRLWTLRRAKKLTYERLSLLPEKNIAVMIPCWHEAGVIEQMLSFNVSRLDYAHYDLFVGVYPNDPTTIASVQAMAEKLPHIQCVINPTPGPTNKADNLNVIYNHILEHEKSHQPYDIFVLHDSEDVIHPLSFKLYNYLIPKNAMVQIPIFPLEVSLKEFTHWTYAAEFSEIHTKDIIVREKIGGLVPSAGVGTAFARHTMDVLKEIRGGMPFSINTLTEDYSTALQIRLHGLREIFASQYVYRSIWRKKWFFFGPIVTKVVKEYIATRALFPTSYIKSVRQKTRWILGISFQEWINSGWTGNFATLYTLVHDRKSIFTHLITGLFFLLIPFWVIYGIFTSHALEYPTLQDLFEKNQWVWNIIVISSFLMANRILQRIISVTRVYGLIYGIWTIPLILYANAINLHALIRAYIQFIFAPKQKSGGKAPKWDKTDHEFPVQNLLIANKMPLGTLLLTKHLITKDQLMDAIDKQGRSGNKLGEILVNEGYITSQQILNVLAKQYNLPIIKQKDFHILSFDKLPKISRYHYDRLMNSGNYPIELQGNNITIAIQDPSNEVQIANILRWTKPYKVNFVMFSI